MPVYVDIYALYHKDEKSFGLIITSLFGLIKINLKYDRVKRITHKVIKLKEKFNETKKKLKPKQKTNRSYFIYFDLTKFFLWQFINYINLHKLNLKLFIGLKDASNTALLMGALYSIIGMLKPVTSNISLSKDYNEEIFIKPFYDQYRFEFELHCKIKFRILHITLIFTKQIIKLIRRRINKWIAIPSRV